MADDIDTRRLAHVLHDANYNLREKAIEVRVLVCAVGLLSAAAFDSWWLGLLVMLAIVEVTCVSAGFFAEHWMKKHGLDRLPPEPRDG